MFAEIEKQEEKQKLEKGTSPGMNYDKQKCSIQVPYCEVEDVDEEGKDEDDETKYFNIGGTGGGG